MKRRVALPSLFVVLCFVLAAIPALASVPPFPPIVFFSGAADLSTPPIGFGPIGPPVGTNQIPSVSWDCPDVSCTVGAIGFWDFAEPNPAEPNPAAISTVGMGTSPFGFDEAGFTGLIQQTGCIHGRWVWCFEYIDIIASIGHPLTVPGGRSWITLSGEILNSPDGRETFWSSSDGSGSPSITLQINPRTGVIRGFPGSLAFTVYAPPVPEPGSMILLGTGVLGVAGVLRRKLRL